MNIIQNLSLTLAAVALTACAHNPENTIAPEPNTAAICVADEAAKLVGQSGLSEVLIKAKTKAGIVRMVAPGQPVTMDYREDRVTVVTNPQTKMIIQASCG